MRPHLDPFGLPVARRGPGLASIAFQLLQGVLIAVLLWAFAFNGFRLLKMGGDSGRAGTLYLFIVALLLAAEVALAAWLILRRRKILALNAAMRRALTAGRAREAREALLRLLDFLEYRLAPSKVYYGLAVTDLFEERRDRAGVLLRKAGAHPAALELRAMLFLADGAPRRARRLLTAAIALFPRRRRLWLALAVAFDEEGNTEKARALLTDVLARWPRFHDARAVLKRLEEGRAGGDLLWNNAEKR